MSNIPDIWRDMDRNFMQLRPLLRHFDELFNEAGAQPARALMPPVDVEEKDQYYALTFDMPGVSKDKIDIQLKDNQLSVTGERDTSREIEQGDQRLVERSRGTFRRMLMLPQGIDADHVEASYKDGVLQLIVPKATTHAGRKIEIGEGRSGFLKHLLGGDKGKEKNVSPDSEKNKTH